MSGAPDSPSTMLPAIQTHRSSGSGAGESAGGGGSMQLSASQQLLQMREALSRRPPPPVVNGVTPYLDVMTISSAQFPTTIDGALDTPYRSVAACYIDCARRARLCARLSGVWGCRCVKARAPCHAAAPITARCHWRARASSGFQPTFVFAWVVLCVRACRCECGCGSCACACAVRVCDCVQAARTRRSTRVC